MARHILHVDCNAFYASVEQQRRPELRGKPVAVCGSQEDRHGIVLTASYPAKRVGVKTGMAIWQARQRCPDLAVLPPDMGEYIRISRLARDIYERFTDQVEPFGLDEAWLDITGSVGLFGTPMEIAKQIRDLVEFELGITVSIGVSDNKVTAKLGSDYRKPDAITRIEQDNYQEIVYPLPVEDLLYVGPATSRKLRGIGIDTIAEAVKRQLDRRGTALIIAECGSGKTKIGSTAIGALHGLWASQHRHGAAKSFGVVMCPSHVSRKWVREIGETLPNTYGMVVRSITDLNRLYGLYEQGDKSVFAVFSKEKARDGYMRYPAVTWNRRKRAFLCPDCMEPIEMEVSDDGSRYMTNADQFFFQTEHKKNHQCPNCGSMLWAPVNPGRQIPWVKIGEYGWVYRYGAKAHLARTKNESVIDQLMKIAENPDGYFPVKGAHRRYPLSTYVKKKLRGRIDGFLADELHEYNNASGQGDAMAELYGASRLFVGMTATLINGYSSGIFHLLYRIVPGLMLKDGKSYKKPGDFDAEYGVVENTYEIKDGDYNSNRRTTKRKARTRQLPGVSPLVFSRFLLEYTAFLSLSDMGKDLPDYEEIPVPLEMPEDVRSAYKDAESTLQRVLKSDRQAAQKILSAYLNLLTVYPDQPYDQPTVVHPIDGLPLVVPQNLGNFERILPKEEETMAIVRRKVAAGERVLIYTSWTRTDSQRKLMKLLREEGYRADILTPNVATEKREEWVEKRVKSGLQVLITNPRCVETGLDLNAFTTLIFYSMGYTFGYGGLRVICSLTMTAFLGDTPLF